MQIPLSIVQNRTTKIYVKALFNDNPITLESGEKLIFGVKRRPDADYAIYKELTSSNISAAGNSYVLALSKSDTNIAPGHYFYDVVYTTSTSAYRIIDRSPFVVENSIVAITS